MLLPSAITETVLSETVIASSVDSVRVGSMRIPSVFERSGLMTFSPILIMGILVEKLLAYGGVRDTPEVTVGAGEAGGVRYS
jgi:hypothetical protein